jgi:hypothetical protein
MGGMKITAITFAIDYADYLRVALPSVSAAVDCLYLTTQRDDECALIGHECGAVVTESSSIRRDGATINKSQQIREAQERVYRERPGDWVLIVDADIVLPSDARAIIEESVEDFDSLYGCVRRNFDTPSDYKAGRVSSLFGPVHCGYFQLYQPTHSRYPLYDRWSSTCEYGDDKFKRLWPDKLRKLLPMTVDHLGPVNVNWSNRVSPQWSTA